MAYVGGVGSEEMNMLEIDFLKYIDWKLWVDPSEYENYTNALMFHFNQN